MTVSPVIQSGKLDAAGQARVRALARDEVAVLTGAGRETHVIEAGDLVPSSNFLSRWFQKEYTGFTIVTRSVLTDTFERRFSSTDARLEYDVRVTVDAKVISPDNYVRDFRYDPTIVSPIRLWLETRIRSIISQHRPNQIVTLRDALQDFANYMGSNKPTEAKLADCSIQVVNLGIDISFSSEAKKLINADMMRGLVESYGPTILLDMAAVDPDRAEDYRKLYQDHLEHPRHTIDLVTYAADAATKIAGGDAILEESLKREPALRESYLRVLENLGRNPRAVVMPPITEVLLEQPDLPPKMLINRSEGEANTEDDSPEAL